MHNDLTATLLRGFGLRAKLVLAFLSIAGLARIMHES